MVSAGAGAQGIPGGFSKDLLGQGRDLCSLWKLLAVTLPWGLQGQPCPVCAAVTPAAPRVRDSLRMLMELAFSPPRESQGCSTEGAGWLQAGME